MIGGKKDFPNGVAGNYFVAGLTMRAHHRNFCVESQQLIPHS